jgi:hypothetical protein
MGAQGEVCAAAAFCQFIYPYTLVQRQLPGVSMELYGCADVEVGGLCEPVYRSSRSLKSGVSLIHSWRE